MNQHSIVSWGITLLIAFFLTGCGSKSNDGAKGHTLDPKPSGESDSPGVPKFDASKGPNGEEIVKVEDAKERKSGFKDAKGKFVRHGPFTVFYDKVDGTKKWQGECNAGQWHGKVTGWYKDGSLWFERWYDKGKPVGTHKGYDGKGNVAWELRFDDGRPRLSEADCFCIICQLAFLYGTSTWDFSNPIGEDSTVYRFTKASRTEIPFSEFVGLLGPPHEKRDVPGKKGFLEEWVYRCKDGTVTCQVTALRGSITMSMTKVSGRRRF